MLKESTRPSLLAKLRSDDASAWSDLVDLYGPLVGYWCRRGGLDPSSTADCVQEVFASVATSIGGFVPHRGEGSFRAWLWTITRNKIIDAGRGNPIQARGGSTAAFQISQIPTAASDDDEPTGPVQMDALVRRAMAQVRVDFNTRTWTMFERCVIDGVPTATVADQMDATPAAVRQARSRVLRRLRQQLGDVQ